MHTMYAGSVRLTDVLDTIGRNHPTSQDWQYDSRRSRKPARMMIDAEKRNPKTRRKPLPNAASFLVRVRAVLEAQEAGDRDCLRGELARLGADCERWATALLTSPTLDAPDEE